MKKLLLFGLILILLSSFVSALNMNDSIERYYKLEDTTLTDEIGGHDGTNSGASAIAGIINNGMDFDGTDYFTIPLLGYGLTDDRTYNFWINADDYSPTSYEVPFTQASDGGTFYLALQSSGALDLVVLETTAPAWDTYTYDCSSCSGWVMVTITLGSSSEWRLYVNGDYKSGGTTTIENRWASQQDWGQASGGSAKFNGIIDEIGIWNRTLDANNITYLYNSGAPNSGQQAPLFESASSGSPENNLTINLFNIYDNSTNLNATVNISGDIFTHETTINTNITLNATQEYELQFYNIYTNDKPYFDRTLRYNLSNSTFEADAYLYPYTSIYALDESNNNSVNNFSISFKGHLYNTTTGVIYLDLYNETQNTTITNGQEGAKLYAFQEQNVTAPAYLQNYTFYLKPYNSIRVYLRNADDNSLITDNITIKVTGDAGQNIYYRTNSTLLLTLLPEDTYNFLIYGENWTQRSYDITVYNGSAQEFTAYLDQATEQVIFTVLDANTNAILPEAIISVSRIIAGVWTVTSSYETDISGKTAFKYVEDVEYRFTTSLTNYESKTFTLNPILFSSYNILLEPSVSIQDSQDYGGVGIVYNPKIYYDNLTNTFTFTITSPAGKLASYGYNLTYPSGNTVNSGGNAYGSVLSDSFHINGSTLWDRIKVNYYYTLSDGTEKNFIYYYNIVVTEEITDLSFTKLRGNTFGLGVFERVLITSFIILLVAGAIGMLAGGVSGGATGFILLAFFQFIGFIPLWSILPSALILFIWLVWRGSQ